LRPLSPGWIWGLELLMLVASAELFTRTNQALTVAKYFFIVPGVLLAVSLLSVSVSDWLIDLSVPAAVVLGYFTFAKLFDTNVRGFVAGTGPYAATAREAAGRLQIACLPASLLRERVLELVAERGSSIKLWEPEAAGLGKLWAAQGWVIWRWQLQGDATAEKGLDVKWLEAQTDTSDDTFSLATAIAQAAASARREKT